MFRKKNIVSLSKLIISLILCSVMLATVAFAETTTDIAMHLYTDPTDGTTFMLPDNWIEEISFQDGYNVVTTYTKRADRKVIFLHVSADDWENGKLYASSRKDYDDLMNQRSMLSMAFGFAKFEEVKFRGIPYFRYKSQESTWQYYRYHNGILHMFQFDVDTDDPYYAYFEAIMNSVVFSTIP